MAAAVACLAEPRGGAAALPPRQWRWMACQVDKEQTAASFAPNACDRCRRCRCVRISIMSACTNSRLYTVIKASSSSSSPARPSSVRAGSELSDRIESLRSHVSASKCVTRELTFVTWRKPAKSASFVDIVESE